MCLGTSTPDPVAAAAAPATPLAPPEEQAIGESRREENEENFGDVRPNYRTNRGETGPKVGSGSNPIQM